MIRKEKGDAGFGIKANSSRGTRICERIQRRNIRSLFIDLFPLSSISFSVLLILDEITSLATIAHRKMPLNALGIRLKTPYTFQVASHEKHTALTRVKYVTNVRLYNNVSQK